MISASNEKLQQELKYTILKPDCHSWWISKMQSDTLEERYAIKLCFKLIYIVFAFGLFGELGGVVGGKRYLFNIKD